MKNNAALDGKFFETLMLDCNPQMKNFKGYPSLLVLAIVDIDYRFRCVRRNHQSFAIPSPYCAGVLALSTPYQVV